MKFKCFLFLYFLLFCVSTSFGKQVSDSIIKMSGLIANKYPIKMTLKLEKDNIYGYYFYEKHQTKIALKGHIQNSVWYISESPDEEFSNELQLGFIGRIDNNNFLGKWVDKNNSKELIFKLTKNDKKSKELPNNYLNNHYSDSVNNDNYIGSLYLKLIDKNIYYFNVITGTRSGCTGFLTNIVEIDSSSNKGVFKNDLCELHFKFNNQNIELIEENCIIHGVHCGFQGTYIKNSP